MPETMQKVTFTCRECGQDKTVHVRPEDLKRWQDGELIQRAMPYLSDAERELFLTQICGACFDKLFREDDEEFADA